MGDNGGNCSIVNVKGTNECCPASTNDTNDVSEKKKEIFDLDGNQTHNL